MGEFARGICEQSCGWQRSFDAADSGHAYIGADGYCGGGDLFAETMCRLHSTLDDGLQTSDYWGYGIRQCLIRVRLNRPLSHIFIVDGLFILLVMYIYDDRCFVYYHLGKMKK